MLNLQDWCVFTLSWGDQTAGSAAPWPSSQNACRLAGKRPPVPETAGSVGPTLVCSAGARHGTPAIKHQFYDYYTSKKNVRSWNIDEKMVGFPCPRFLWQFSSLFSFSAVQSTFRWDWKQANGLDGVKYLQKASSSLWLVILPYGTIFNWQLTLWFETVTRFSDSNFKRISWTSR